MGSTLEVRHLYACAMCDTVRALKAPVDTNPATGQMSCAACHHSTVPKKLEIHPPDVTDTTAPMIVRTRQD